MSDLQYMTHEPLERAGWHPGIIGYATAPNAERTSTPGYIRGLWGIFGVTLPARDGLLSGASMTHLPSGFRFAFFDEMETAAEAVEMIEGLCDFSTLTVENAPTPEWGAQAEKIFGIWARAGITRTGPVITGKKRMFERAGP